MSDIINELIVKIPELEKFILYYNKNNNNDTAACHYEPKEKKLVLRNIKLGNRKFSDDETAALCDFLSAHPEIEKLDLSYNEIHSDGAKRLASVKTITSLNLSNNKIGNEGAESLAANETLTYLDVSYNNEINKSGKSKLVIARFLLPNNPVEEENKIRRKGNPGDVPSLLEISLFKINLRFMFDTDKQRQEVLKKLPSDLTEKLRKPRTILTENNNKEPNKPRKKYIENT